VEAAGRTSGFDTAPDAKALSSLEVFEVLKIHEERGRVYTGAGGTGPLEFFLVLRAFLGDSGDFFWVLRAFWGFSRGSFGWIRTFLGF
jgi:hypothetical protein